MVSIILPTYNRARFLPQAFAAIRSQAWSDWELIVVDDGSTDETHTLVADFATTVSQPVEYIYQQNQGAYGARNTGLARARGRYIAFYDSDDIWLPHHLADCVTGLVAHPAVDWIYGACRVVEEGTQTILAATTFYEHGRPRPFLQLKNQATGQLHLIDDLNVTRCMLLHGLYCGLQNSVIRQRVFAAQRFEALSRNEAEDQLIVIRALVQGCRFAYMDNVHVEYRVHADNSSGAAQHSPIDKQLRIYRTLIQGFERLAEEVPLRRRERQALRQRLGREYFWHLGYALLWQHGLRREALTMFHRGLRYWPWHWALWKTYLLARIRTIGVPRVASGASEAMKRLL